MKKSYTILKLALIALLFLSGVKEASAQIWTNPITGTNPNTSNPYTTGDVFTMDILVSGVGRGSGIIGANANNRYNASGWNSATLDTADYFYFTIKNNNIWGFAVNGFKFTSQASSSGPTMFSVRYSIDNYATDIGTAYASGDTISFLPTGIFSSDSVTFKVFAWGASAAGGTFSNFAFDGAIPLSIVFENFNVTKRANMAYLTWKLGGIQEGEAIGIQHSTDGKNFRILKTVGTDEPVFIHENPAAGINYYRLSSTELNGKQTFSDTRSLIFDEKKQEIMLYPNPAEDKLHIDAADGREVRSVIVYNLSGGIALKAWNQKTVDITGLSTGMYSAKIAFTNGETAEIAFLVQ